LGVLEDFLVLYSYSRYMSQNRFWNLLAKKLTGEALPAELSELEQIMKANPEWVYPAEHIENLWKLRIKERDAYDAELAFELHLNQQKKNGLNFPDLDTPLDTGLFDPPPSRKRFRNALVALLLLCVSGLIWKYTTRTGGLSSKKAFSEVSTRPGSRSKLVLPDSTVVWLNAGSKLTYSEQFGITNRNTTLTGEAFFDVKKSHIPFIIHANSVQIKVLGTAFNVKSYPNEKTTETSLIRGRLEITLDKRPGEKFILKPNEKLVIANEMGNEMEEARAEPELKKEPIVVLGGLTRNRDDNTILETSWVENKLEFQDEPFAEIAKKMERWYDVTIEIKDEKMAGQRLTGTFEKEDIKQALTALQIAYPFNFTINNNHIIITQ
jgi:transmembrane sensor